MDPDQLEQANNAGGGMLPMIIIMALVVLMIAAMWKLFTKAGEPGWAAIVPIYNTIVLLKIAGKPLWWIILLIIPIVSLVIAILMSLGIAEKFGKGAGYGIGLAFLPFIFYPMLAFGDTQYIGPKTA
jgi:hypothetical protein